MVSLFIMQKTEEFLLDNSNEFILKLSALLDQKKSKRMLNSNIKELEKVISKIKLVATFAKGNTKTELNQAIKQMEGQLRQVKIQAKLDSRQLNREINRVLRNVSTSDIHLNINSNSDRLNAQVRRTVAQARDYIDRHPLNLNIGLKKEKLSNQLTSFLNKHTKINESAYWLKEANRIRTVIDSISNRSSLRDARDEFNAFTSGVRATGYAAVSTSTTNIN